MDTGLITKAQNVITRAGGRTLLKVQKYSPEILLGVGVVGLVTSTVLIVNNTSKAKVIKAQWNVDINDIGEVEARMNDDDVPKTNGGQEYTEVDAARDKVVVTGQAYWKFVKLYGPPAALGLASLSCIFGSHRIMQKRYVSVAAAYRLIQTAYAKYRERVVDDVGQDKDVYYRHGVAPTDVEVEVIDDKGKKKKVIQKVVDYSAMPADVSEYAKFFDDYSPYWSKSADLNRAFLQLKQNMLNDLLTSRGHVFLNEVYDELGLLRTSAGAVVGWVSDGPDSDNYIDFGIFDIDDAGARRFVNGFEESVLLDFNVDGLIWEMI